MGAGSKRIGGARPNQTPFLADEQNDAYLAGEPADDARFIPVFAHALEHTGGYSPEEATRVAGRLLPDVLRYDLRRPKASFPDNGRGLIDDVSDIFLAILTNGKADTGDNVGPHNDVLDVFPYLGPPHSVRTRTRVGARSALASYERKETTHMTVPTTSSTLSVNVFTAPGKTMVGERPKPFGEPLGFDPITSTLIYGEYDAVLVDAMGTVAEAEALAAWVALHNRNLETIYITHAHFDHFYGLSILLDRFPNARAIATPNTVKAMQSSFTPPVERLARRMFPGQVPAKLVPPEPYEHGTFTLEGHELRIIEEGRTDSPDSTSLYVPSIGLIVAGDVVYNQCHMYVGDTTPESRKNWIADLDRLAALDPTMVVAGHKKTGAPDSPSAIQDTKRYLLDFDRLKQTTASEEELFKQMTALYPDWAANQSWLMFGFPSG